MYWDQAHFGLGFRKGNVCKVQEFKTRVFSKLPRLEMGIEWVLFIKGKFLGKDLRIEL